MDEEILVIGYLGGGNLGDEFSLLGLLYKYGKHRSIKLSVLSVDPRIFKAYHPIVSKYANIFKLSFINILVPLLRSRKVVIIGGHYLGNLLELFTLVYIAVLAKLMKKEVLLESIGLYPYRTRVGFNIRDLNSYKLGTIRILLTKILLILSDYISVRDISSKMLINRLIGKKVFLNLDLALNIPVSIIKKYSSLKKEPMLGLSIGYIIDKAFPVLIRELYKAIIELMKRCPELRVMCIPFSIPIREDLKTADNDLRLCQLFHAHLPRELETRFIVVRKRLTPMEALRLLSKLDCIVTLRYHPFILASKLDMHCIVIPHELKVYDYVNLISIFRIFGNANKVDVITLESISSRKFLEHLKTFRCS